jgi:hypothetical protein
LSFSNLASAVVIAAGAVFIAMMAPWFVGLLSTGDLSISTSLWNAGDHGDASRMEHLNSVLGGIDLFLKHPLVGAGLGAFMEAQIKLGNPLVIHSTPVWLLAETGILGSAVMMFPIIRWFVREMRNLADEASAFLVLIIVAFAIVCQVHEICISAGSGYCLARGWPTSMANIRGYANQEPGG